MLKCSNLTTSCSPTKEYCKKCSHANYFGEVIVSGRTWKFSFNPQFGPLFLRQDGEPMNRQPTEYHPVWDKWELWHTENFK
jgi:hypothetical protein